MHPDPEPAASTPAGPMRYLALGDSYTIGEGVEARGSWPMQLARALRAEGFVLADPQVIATTGWTTDELDAAIDAAAPADDFDLASLLVGVNNQYRGRGLEDYREQFAALLERAIGFARGDAGRVLVLSIPDWGVTPFAAGSGRDVAVIGRELDAEEREQGVHVEPLHAHVAGHCRHLAAAVKAQVDYIKERVPGAEVFVHPHTGEAGALGAALSGAGPTVLALVAPEHVAAVQAALREAARQLQSGRAGDLEHDRDREQEPLDVVRGGAVEAALADLDDGADLRLFVAVAVALAVLVVLGWAALNQRVAQEHEAGMHVPPAHHRILESDHDEY